MLNQFAKGLLVATSMAPILGAVAVNQIAQDRPWSQWLPWLAATVLLGLICWLMLLLVTRTGEQHRLTIKEFENSDKEIVVFLLTYLLPFLATDKLDFTGEWITGAYIFAVIFFTVAHAGAFHFNPVMGLLGYHFYSIKDDSGASCLLISKKAVRRPGEALKVVELTDGIYLQRT